jgi:hypothetical protein
MAASSIRVFAQVYLDFCWSDGNSLFIDAILKAQRASLLNEGGLPGSITVATENGKSMTRNVGLSAENAYAAAGMAKKWYVAGYREIPTRTVGVFC